MFFFFSSRRRHTRLQGDWSSDVCSSDLRSYREIVYRNLYDGVDLVYHTGEAGLKYEFLVSPAAHEDKISIAYDGVQTLSLVGDELVAQTPFGSFRDAPPIAFVNGASIACRYFLQDVREVGFRCGPRTASGTLVIDPLLYSTFLGGVGQEEGYLVRIDSSGNAFLTGYTGSFEFPTTPGVFDTSFNLWYDVFVTEFNASGTGLIYSTFIGGA